MSIYTGADFELLFPVGFGLFSAWSDQHNESKGSEFMLLYFGTYKDI